MTRPALLLALCGLLSSFLVWMVLDHNHARNSGTEIILDMEPVDPRSLFRGHFVIIRTPLHDLNLTNLEGDDDFEDGDRVYVTLAQNPNGDWLPVSTNKTKPDSTQTFLQGRVENLSVFSARTGDEYPLIDHRGLDVQYKIESYFADKASAKALERKVREAKMRVILSVTKDGQAVIRGIEINGERHLDKL
ncbi:MAG: hypothetical protein COA47_04220 [Robiginitomaculum sp.]|nr:MAG: hypothetical protein COA47_04220 [Robiginitomaculum sp.]